MRLSLRSASAFSLRSLAPLAFVLSFSGMGETKTETVRREMAAANAWAEHGVAAFIVERDAKRDAAWARYAAARAEQAVMFPEHEPDPSNAARVQAEFTAASSALFAMGITMETLDPLGMA